MAQGSLLLFRERGRSARPTRLGGHNAAIVALAALLAGAGAGALVSGDAAGRVCVWGLSQQQSTVNVPPLLPLLQLELGTAVGCMTSLGACVFESNPLKSHFVRRRYSTNSAIFFYFIPCCTHDTCSLPRLATAAPVLL